MTDEGFREEVLQRLTAIETLLRNGLVKDVDEVCKKQEITSNRLWLLIGILGGSGLLTGSVLGILKLVGG